MQEVEPCPAPFELVNNNQFCYLYSETTVMIPQPQLQKTCQAFHPCAHLVAINTQQEQDFIKDYVTTTGPTSTEMWTSGRTDNPAGLTGWYWDLGTTTQGITYFAWKDGQPDNGWSSTIENAIFLEPANNFQWADVMDDLRSIKQYFPTSQFCYLCEIDLNT